MRTGPSSWLLFAALASSPSLTACGTSTNGEDGKDDDGKNDDGSKAPTPSVTDPAMDGKTYGETCKALVASVPSFNCMDGTVVAVTVNGKEPAEYTKNMDCDRPALLPYDEGSGQCIPWSRALVLRDDARAQIQATCRKKLIRPKDDPLFDEIDVIAHSVVDGTTCWFQAKPDNPTNDPKIGVDGTKVPSPTMDEDPAGYPDPSTFWDSPQETAAEKCGNCHDNDPFYLSPWIAQTGELPADPLGRYNNLVGPMSKWTKPMAIETPGNTCTGCHRIGNLHTCGEGMVETYDPSSVQNLDEWGKQYAHSHWMPVGNKWTMAQWEVVYRESIQALEQCCKDPASSDCTLTPVESYIN